MIKVAGLLLFLGCFVFAKAQNVGINTANPTASLDINGDIILRNSNMTLVNGANENIATTALRFSHYTISGPTTVFEIGGLTGGIDGRQITLYNSSAFLMVIKHLSAGSSPENQISTGSGTDLTLSSYSTVSLRYMALDNLWHITSSHNEWNPILPGYWEANGPHIYNINSGFIGIATNNPTEKLHIDSGSLKIGRNIWNSSATNNLLKFGDADYVTIGEGEGDDQLVFSAKNFIFNPSLPSYSGNLQIGNASSLNSSQITFPNRLGNKISFWSAGPNNDFGIGLNSGNLQLYTAGNDKISFGNGNANAFNESVSIYTGGGQKGIYTPQTGNLNIVPLGVIHYDVITSNGIATGQLSGGNVFVNLAGNLAYNQFTYVTHFPTREKIEIQILLDDPNVLSHYSSFFVTGIPNFTAFNALPENLSMSIATINTVKQTNPIGGSSFIQIICQSGGVGTGGMHVNGKLMVYGIK